jgi:hypothetical protein
MLLWLVTYLIAEPDRNLSKLSLTVGMGTFVSIAVAWPLVLGVLSVAVIFAASVSRHPHLWSAATVVAMAFGSFALFHFWDESPRHVFDLTPTTWELIYLSIALVAAGAVVFSGWSIWSPLESSDVSSILAANPWIRRSKGIAVALLGMAAIVIGALSLEHFLKSDSCLERGGFLNRDTGECLGARD